MLVKANTFLNPFNFGINLITPRQLKTLPEGTKLYSITGEVVVVGADYIDDDTRGGFLAYGLPVEKEE